MKRKIIIFICAWSALFTAWTFANPPSGIMGTTKGIISSNSLNDIGIRMETPITALDVNGTMTIRKSLDMTNNRILNVATPTSSADAANKAYVDTQIANISSSTTKIWSQGRPGTAVINAAGECTRTIGGTTVKISRSTRPTTWDKTPAACPANWWVCSAADRGAAICGSGNRTYIECNQRQTPTPTYADDLATYTPGFTWGWISDAGITTNQPSGGFIDTTGILQETYSCDIMPVWCCSYQ